MTILKQQSIETYKNIIKQYSPVICIKHNISLDGKYSINKSIYKKLSTELNELRPYTKCDLLRRKIEQRIFEINIVDDLQYKPQLFIDQSISALTANWRTANYLVDNCLNENNFFAVRDSLKDLYCDFKSNFNRYSKFDCLYALDKLNYESLIIKQRYKFSQIEDNLFHGSMEFIEKLKKDMNVLKQNYAYLYKPLTADNLKMYFYYETGLRIDFDLLYQDLKDLHMKLSQLINHQVNITNATVTINKENINNALSKLKGFFCTYSDFSEIDNVSVIWYNANMFNRYLNFSYLKNYDISSEKKRGIVIINPNKKINDIEFSFKLIHEIFGHYFADLKGMCQPYENLLSDNLVIEEGWAKYLEYLYAKNSSEEQVKQYFLKNIVHIIISAIVAIMMHYYNYSIKCIYDEIKDSSYLESKSINSIILNSYLNPYSAISYIVGLLLFIKKGKVTFDIEQLLKMEYTGINDGYSFKQEMEELLLI